MKWTLIVNPTSGGGKAQKIWPQIRSALHQENIDFEYYFTESKNHAIHLSKNLTQQGKRNFAVVGGDGTLNEVINGLCAQQDVPLGEFVVGCIPIGTASDWVKSHGIPTQINKAILLLKKPNLLEHDIGVAKYDRNEVRYFINVAGLAFDAFVAKRIEKYSMKGRIGHLFYLYGIFISLHKYASQPFTFSVNNKTFQGPYFCLNIGICQYSGGGMRLVPKAIPDDGLLDITVMDKMNIWEVLLNLKYLYNGKIQEHKKVQHFRASSIQVHPLKAAIPFELDGEFIGNIPVEFSIHKEKIKMVIPNS